MTARVSAATGAAANAVLEASPAATVERRRGLSFASGAMLSLIGVTVVLVSLPRLRRFALRENETDAVHMLRILSTDAVEHGEALSSGDLAAVLAASTAHRMRLEDVEVLDDGRLRRHGYLFAAVEGDPGRFVLLAWPWEHGRTGLGAFAAEPGKGVVGLENQDGRYSGPDRPPPHPAGGEAAPWRSMSAL